MDLSIIIPVYNAAPLLDRCLDSIFNQTTQYTYEVILVDDGSTDNSIEIIKKRKEKNIVLHQQHNAGPAKARNKGVELAQGKYCAFLDADDYWLDGFIEKTLMFLETHTSCVAVNVGQKHCTMDNGTFINPSFLSNEQLDKQAYLLSDFYSFWGKHNHVCTGSVTMKTEVLHSIGGQRTDMRICEDLEFWPMIASYGKWGFIPEILFISDGGAINRKYGWNKYTKRFQNIPMYTQWFSRLAIRLTNSQKEILRPILNDVVIGITRAMISGGDFKRAKLNMQSYIPTDAVSYIYKISNRGEIIWYIFSTLYRSYQYLKINLPYYKNKLGLR